MAEFAADLKQVAQQMSERGFSHPFGDTPTDPGYAHGRSTSRTRGVDTAVARFTNWYVSCVTGQRQRLRQFHGGAGA